MRGHYECVAAWPRHRSEHLDLTKPRPFRPDRVPAPVNGVDFRYPQQPLDIEIGCGVGLHPIQYAQAYPERYLVAIEQTREKFAKFQRRFAHHDLSNLLPVHANAIAWVTHALREQSVERFFFLYPNPNPKASDLNKRWHAMPFMSQVIACLKPNGQIHMATNVEAYALEARAYFEQIWKLATVRFARIRAGDITPRTHFETKYLARGQTCFDMVFRKAPPPPQVATRGVRSSSTPE